MIVVALALPLQATAATPKLSRKWKRLTTPRFTLLADTRTGTTRRIAADLEGFARVLAGGFPGSTMSTSDQFTLYAFGDHRDFTRYAPPQLQGRDIAGFFSMAAGVSSVAIDSEAWDDYRRTLFHEYVHDFLQRNFRPLPDWLEEGLAEYYSTFRLSGESAQIGRPVDIHIVVLRSRPLIDLDELLVFDALPDRPHRDSRLEVFYAESWALVHYLLVGNRQRTPQLIAYLDAVERGASSPEAFAAAFDCRPSILLDELRDYVRRDIYRFLKLRFEEAKEQEQFETEELGAADALCALGDLVVRTWGPAQEYAAAHFEQALRLDPRSACGLVHLGLVAVGRGDLARARSILADELRGHHPRSVYQQLESQLVLAQLERTRTLVDGGSPCAALHLLRALATEIEDPLSRKRIYDMITGIERNGQSQPCASAEHDASSTSTAPD